MKDIHPSDAQFIACALAIPDSVIWSNDRHFKKQHAVPVLMTSELLVRLREEGTLP